MRNKDFTQRVVLFFLILIFTFMFYGCGGKPQLTQNEQAAPKVILGAGDVLEIKFFRTPELNEIQTIRPDGKITMQLIGEVEIKGKTPLEVKNNLIELYSKQLNSPEISVTVQTLYSNRIYVGGQVNSPGYFESTGQITALEAIMQAGGFNLETAKLEKVTIIRTKNDQRYGYTINLKPALKGKENQPFYLESFDIVYVPKNKTAVIAQWIDTHIDAMIPQILIGTVGLFLIRDVIVND